jgi:hypothetical protein
LPDPGLGDNAQLFGAAAIDGEGNGSAEDGIRPHDGGLDIVRIDVSATDDDQVLDATCDE